MGSAWYCNVSGCASPPMIGLPVGMQAKQHIAALFQIERQVKECLLQERQAIRQARAKPLCEDLHAWLRLDMKCVPEGRATAKAIAYSLSR